MSRYRPPAEKSSPYITAAGAKQLRDELDYLWNERRPLVVKAMADAAAEGDRSENAEYIYRKKELREIDRRAGYLSRRLEQIKVVDRVPDDTGKVFFGATVELVDEQGASRRYRIVGADEINAEAGWISIDSPVARAIIGKSLDDVVSVRLPGGETELEIAAIEYES